MKKTLLISAIAILTVLLTSAVWAQGPGPQGNRDCMGMGPKAPMGGGQPGCGMRGPGMGHGCKGGPGMGHDGMPGIKMILRNADKIDLTDSQREQFEKMMVDHQLARVELKAKIEKAQIRVRALMRDPKAPESEVMRAIDNASLARAEMAKQRYRNRQQVFSVLTQAQIDKLTDLRDEWREERCENRMGMERGKSFRGRRFGH